jgi:hypothetical protein
LRIIIFGLRILGLAFFGLFNLIVCAEIRKSFAIMSNGNIAHSLKAWPSLGYSI